MVKLVFVDMDDTVLSPDKTISEDEFSAGEKEVEKMVADAVAKVDATATAKEKEVMTV